MVYEDYQHWSFMVSDPHIVERAAAVPPPLPAHTCVNFAQTACSAAVSPLAWESVVYMTADLLAR